ncbi:2,3,4,5-tetrahydropyridine-2,6-dicarboxylate N-succinyltransferase [Alloactinosynnema sp. L-07]|uniref:hypothetical protein n=1 Tax=Alloactinosynnema sp. L-07 TaxID=1653480 RepID=UPI00065F0836|nr:hypothetical protein [Alloactinosynnema sp. L-07]CRK61672.1 2,3,4,5-tetrahydropyridine-2,6-dicarboxylate N-succinyltransferase [Alloactinosynnema sp. L-07]
MSRDDRLFYVGLLLLSALLAVVELLFLPLRLDGRVLPNLGALPFPITVVLAALTLPKLVGAASRLSLRTAVAAGPVFAWLAVLLAGLLVTPGGDWIILADWRTLLLLAAGALPAAVKIGDVLAKATLAAQKGKPHG